MFKDLIINHSITVDITEEKLKELIKEYFNDKNYFVEDIKFNCITVYEGDQREGQTVGKFQGIKVTLKEKKECFPTKTKS